MEIAAFPAFNRQGTALSAIPCKSMQIVFRTPRVPLPTSVEMEQHAFRCSRDQPEMRQPRRSAVKKDGLEHLLLVLHPQGVGREKLRQMGCNLSRGSLEETSPHPDNLQRGNQTDESGVLVAQPPIDDVVCLARLFRVSLEEIAEDDVGIETNHRLNRLVAPASMAAFISSTEMGRFRRGTDPLRVAVLILGRMTTLPSGCKKNLNRSPGLRFK